MLELINLEKAQNDLFDQFNLKHERTNYIDIHDYTNAKWFFAQCKSFSNRVIYFINVVFDKGYIHSIPLKIAFEEIDNTIDHHRCSIEDIALFSKDKKTLSLHFSENSEFNSSDNIAFITLENEITDQNANEKSVNLFLKEFPNENHYEERFSIADVQPDEIIFKDFKTICFKNGFVRPKINDLNSNIILTEYISDGDFQICVEENIRLENLKDKDLQRKLNQVKINAIRKEERELNKDRGLAPRTLDKQTLILSDEDIPLQPLECNDFDDDIPF